MGLFDGVVGLRNVGSNERGTRDDIRDAGARSAPGRLDDEAVAAARLDILKEHHDEGPTTNHPFSANLRHVMPGMGPVKRGRMVTDTELRDAGKTLALVGKGSTDLDGLPAKTIRDYKLYFLYNPTTINYGYDRTEGIPYDFLSPEDRIAVAITSGVRVNFQLLFDRTHEYMRNPKGNGVGQDIEVFQKMTGIWDQGVLISPPVKVYFGDKLWVRGFISSASITYAHFSSKMTPLRAVVDIGVETRFQSDESIPLDAAGSEPGKEFGSKGPTSVSTGSGRIQ